MIGNMFNEDTLKDFRERSGYPVNKQDNQMIQGLIDSLTREKTHKYVPLGKVTKDEKVESFNLNGYVFNGADTYYIHLSQDNLLTFIAILPGMYKDSFSASYDEGIFKCEAKYVTLDAVTKYKTKELSISHKIKTNLEIDITRKIYTEYTDGVLTIKLALKEKSISKKVEIKLS
jgi:hypothetical protein